MTKKATKMVKLRLVLVIMLCLKLPINGALMNQDFPPSQSESKIVLSPSRGYINVLIAIGESVTEDQNLIVRIKEIFSEFSSTLYNVTKLSKNEYHNGVFLEEVSILIPDSWNDDSSYQSSTGESFATSDVRIDRSNFEGLPNSNQPYTYKVTACGSSGLYIRLTPDYISNIATARPYGDRSKLLVHEWAHFRWGVFDEYPLAQDDHFYASSNGDFQATKCVAAIPGQMVNSDSEKCFFKADGAPYEDCRFLDDRTGNYLASLMYKQFLPQVQKFCDSPDYTFGDPAITHNAEAPNRQNIECASMSIWEVLRQHSDFRNISDTFVGGFRPVNFQPTFRILKRRGSTAPLILVLDTSASMNDFQRLHTLRQASYNLITRVLNDDQVFAVVIFNSEATLVIEADRVGVERDALPNRLPVQGLGHTSIASGVILAIQELKSSLPNYAGSNMIVLTDGEETVEPRLTGLNFSELAGITVHTIAFGQRADSILEDLAIRTGGRTFQHRDESTNLFSIFTRLAVQDDSGTVEIFSENFNLINSTRRFFMDPNSGDQISILITFPQYHLSKSDVQVMKPNGDVINSTATLPDVYRSVLAFDLIEIDSEVMVGEWQIRVSYFDTIPPMFMGAMHVVTKRLPGIQKLPIQIDATWALSSVGKIEIQTLYVAVSQGYTPIINADVRVTVMVPNGPHVPLEVWDDGVGPDVRSGDGVYSGFFTQFKGIGRYSVKITVFGVSTVTKVLQGVFVGQGLAAADPELIQESSITEMDSGLFERSIEGNSFKCTDELACSGKDDIFAPYRVTDLRGYTIKENATAVLTFTAPGDDVFEGTASYYELHIAKNITHLLRQFNETEVLQYIPFEDITNETMPPYVISGNLFAPLPARSGETFYIQLPEEEGKFSYIFSIVAVDDVGQRSLPSNFATVSTAYIKVKAAGSFPLSIIGGIVMLLVLLLLLSLLAFLIWKRTRSKEDDTESNHSNRDIVRNSTPPKVCQVDVRNHAIDDVVHHNIDDYARSADTQNNQSNYPMFRFGINTEQTQHADKIYSDPMHNHAAVNSLFQQF